MTTEIVANTLRSIKAQMERNLLNKSELKQLARACRVVRYNKLLRLSHERSSLNWITVTITVMNSYRQEIKSHYFFYISSDSGSRERFHHHYYANSYTR